MFNRVFASIGLIAVLAGCGAANMPDGPSSGTSSQTKTTATPLGTEAPLPSPAATADPNASGYPLDTVVPAETTAYPGPTVGTDATQATAYPGPDATPADGTASEPTEDVVAVWTRSGGFAGFKDSIVVYTDGRVEIDRNGSKSIEQIAPVALEKLTATFASAEWGALQSVYGIQFPDAFAYSIKTSDKLVRTFDGAESPAALTNALQQFSALYDAAR